LWELLPDRFSNNGFFLFFHAPIKNNPSGMNDNVTSGDVKFHEEKPKYAGPRKKWRIRPDHHNNVAFVNSIGAKKLWLYSMFVGIVENE